MYDITYFPKESAISPQEIEERMKKDGVKVRPDIKLDVIYDDNPINPREFDSLGTFVAFHRRYNLGDEHKFRNPQEVEEFLKETNSVYLPVYMLDHSGQSVRTYPFTDVDPQGWDSGQIGYIYATHEDIVKIYGVDSSDTRKIALKTLRGEIEDLDRYLTDQCYGYVIHDLEGNQISSCWGYYDVDLCYADGADEYNDIVTERESLTSSMEYTDDPILPEQGFKFGDKVEVRNSDSNKWVKAIFLENGHIRELPFTVMLEDYMIMDWKYCRHADW